MATLHGNDGAIIIDGTTLAAVRNFSVETSADTIETTVMGLDARTYVKGMSTFSGSADIYFDDSQFSSNVFNPANSTGTVGQNNVSGKFYLDQDATNDIIVWANSMIVTGFTINSSMDGMVEGSLSFQGSGSLGYSNTGNL
jgi:hypothetical protein